VSFTMKDDPKQEIELGVIAQDVEPIFPVLVQTDANGMKSMNYIGLIAPMIEAIKTQQLQIVLLQWTVGFLVLLVVAQVTMNLTLNLSMGKKGEGR